MNGSASRVWLLRSGSDKKYLGLAGHIRDHAFWERNFNGKLMPENWGLPPIEVLGRSKKLGDYVGWMLAAPVVSERAKAILEPIFGDDAQFVRFHDIREKPYYGINVMRLEPSFLDVDRSKCTRNSDGSILSCSRYFFKKDLPPDSPGIFKVSGGSDVFVTRRAAEAIVANKLTGFCLQDPFADDLLLISQEQPLNAYPGLI